MRVVSFILSLCFLLLFGKANLFAHSYEVPANFSLKSNSFVGAKQFGFSKSNCDLSLDENSDAEWNENFQSGDDLLPDFTSEGVVNSDVFFQQFYNALLGYGFKNCDQKVIVEPQLLAFNSYPIFIQNSVLLI